METDTGEGLNCGADDLREEARDCYILVVCIEIWSL